MSQDRHIADSPFRDGVTTALPYWSRTHAEALARLQYLVDERLPLGVLSGPAGSGKSHTLRRLAAEARRSTGFVAHIDSTGLDDRGLLWQTCAALQLAPPIAGSPHELWRLLADHIVGASAAGSSVVLLHDHFDQAGRDAEVVLHRMSRLHEQAPGSVTQIVAPACPSQLSPDLVVRLAPLTVSETADYIAQRLQDSALDPRTLTPEAVRAVHRASVGGLRDINRLCDLVLVAAMADGRTAVDADLVLGLVEELAPVAA